MRLYIDASAAAKLLLAESESAALAQFCDQDDVELLATDLLETELRRVAVRAGQGQAAVTAVLAGINLYELPRSGFAEAGTLPGVALRSLGALHLVGARRLGVDGVIVYDARMASAANELGLPVFAPGR